MRRLCVLAGLLFFSGLACAQALGVVMMHGKWGQPPSWTQPVAESAEREGWTVVQLTMPWAGNRLYDADYDSALAQVAEAVKALRAKGVKRVVVAGHSFGANAALAYAGRGGDTDGIVAMAPGHNPRRSYEEGVTRDAVDRARTLVAAGQSGERIDFVDVNQGKRRSLSTRAEVFLSYFDPDGLGDMPTSVSRIPHPLPLLWVVGTRDPLYPAGQGYAYDKAPAHALSRYVVVDADHVQTPSAGREQIIDWLRSLAAQP